jgi:hypothetical protein
MVRAGIKTMSAVFSCREASRLISESQDHPLVMHQRIALRIHTLLCAACRSYERQIIFIDEVFRLRALKGNPDLPTSESLDDAARERIRIRLADHGGDHADGDVRY